jgi:hypothetical protein
LPHITDLDAPSWAGKNDVGHCIFL